MPFGFRAIVHSLTTPANYWHRLGHSSNIPHKENGDLSSNLRLIVSLTHFAVLISTGIPFFALAFSILCHSTVSQSYLI